MVEKTVDEHQGCWCIATDASFWPCVKGSCPNDPREHRAREHREIAARIVWRDYRSERIDAWIESGIWFDETNQALEMARSIAQSLADAEQRGYGRGERVEREACVIRLREEADLSDTEEPSPPEWFTPEVEDWIDSLIGIIERGGHRR